ncbi:GNAT family N-acetyltransferase, partial [Mycobacterium sp.]|uniref:GNAT family N-acetyltransferase n=1 Tax=Mycobacterium sp. TaxID=1785 RepID=UPI00263072DC
MESLIRTVHVARADSADAVELASLAALTFPLACPPTATPENIASFVEANLSAERFAEYLADPRRVILTATLGGRIIGYAMLVGDATDDAAELSKIYVLPGYHGGGVSSA